MHQSMIVLVISALAFGQFAQALELPKYGLANHEMRMLEEDFKLMEDLFSTLSPSQTSVKQDHLAKNLLWHNLVVAYKRREATIKDHLNKNSLSFNREDGEELHLAAYAEMLPYFTEAAKIQTKLWNDRIASILISCGDRLEERLRSYLSR
jgi:hypothetical protein